MTTIPHHICIPAAGGTYALVLSCPGGGCVSIGKLGELSLARGFHIYAGSAFGPGGLRARLARHALVDKKRHWHIDHLRPHVRLHAIWWVADPLRREHQWAAALGDLRATSIPLPRFGASDCHCPAHLFFSEREPSPGAFLRRLRVTDPPHPPLRRVFVSSAGL